MTVYPITPVPKPRMTQRDRWSKRPSVLRYWAFRDEVRKQNVALPIPYHVTFVLPMPKSWTKKKREAMNGAPHRTTPDRDNLEKGLLDAVFKNDAVVHDGRVTKIWGYTGQIRVESLA